MERCDQRQQREKEAEETERLSKVRKESREKRMCAAIDASRIFQMGKEPCGGLEAIYSAERMLELKRRQEPSVEDTSLRGVLRVTAGLAQC